MKYAAVATVAILSSMSSEALAADFFGPRIQLIAGWDSVNFENDENNVDVTIDGTAFGIASGYDFALSDTMIAGIGLSTTFQDNKKTRVVGADTFEFKAKRDFEIAARVGTILAETALLYAKVGYANAKVEVEANVGGVFVDDSESGSGLRLGVGSEIAITEPLAFVIEYRYTDYEKGFTRNQVLGGLSYRF